MKILYSIVFILSFISIKVHAQVDSIVFTNNNIIVGEIKSLDKGIIIIETDYSDSDFKIEWEGIKEIYAKRYFLISLSDGRRFNGKFHSTSPDSLIVTSDQNHSEKIIKDNLVFLKAIDSDFWSRLYASIDFGFNFTKANNLKQISIRSNMGYLADRWSADASYNNVSSTQDEIESIERTDASLSFRYYLPKDWFTVINFSFLSNTEQKLDLRTNSRLGFGKYIIHTNKKYWGFQVGGNFNNEKFSTETAAKQSMEGYVGTELNLFDIGDFSLLTRATAYPSITEKNRWRADVNIDTKYDLPLDFYIKLGFTLNYDNQPVEGATDTDYVFQSTIGWEL